MDLDDQYIVITGNLTLSEQLGSPLVIKTKYLDVQQKTTINTATLSIQGDGAANIRFKNGYDQKNSDIKIDGSDKVIFGGLISLTQYNGWKLGVTANDIYFDSDQPIKFQQGGNFTYTSLNSVSTRMHVGADIQSWFWSDFKGNLIANGDYISSVATDVIPNNLVRQGNYTGPIWPALSITYLNPPEPSASDILNDSHQGNQNADKKRGTESYY